MDKIKTTARVGQTKESWRDNFDERLLRKVEKILRILEDEEHKQENLKSQIKIKEVDIKSLKNELREKKREINRFKKEIGSLNDLVGELHESHITSAEVSVDLYIELEFHKYRASFLDINIKIPTGIKKLKEYGKNIKRFFLEDLKCNYINIVCNGIMGNDEKILNIKTKKKNEYPPDFNTNLNNVYYMDLVDVDLPERKIGRIIIGRHPYESAVKENKHNDFIQKEIYFTKRILENTISEIQNKELAVKDPLTGLNTRKFLEERLSEEFRSMDYFSFLHGHENNVLNTVIKTDGSPESLVIKQFFHDFKTKDEEAFYKAIADLQMKGLIKKQQLRHLGKLENHYFFESSKKSYDLFAAMLDLDHFKDVNDNWGGHSVGDRVLKEFSEIMKKHIRTTDIPIRYGGEEFLILFPRSTSIAPIKNAMSRIRKDCEQHLMVEHKGKKRNVTVSIGITRINKYDKRPQQLINRADEALYKAKIKRNNIAIFGQEKNGYFEIQF